MKARFIFTLFAAAALFVNAQEQPVDYKLNVSNFCELTVVDGVNVDYHCNADSAGWAVFTCLPSVASKIMFSNNAEKLTIQTDADESAIVGVPAITVYSASLRKCENSGDSLVRVFASVPVKAFKARQIGNGRLEVHGVEANSVDAGITAGKGSIAIDGKTPKATLRNVSTGPIDAVGLIADKIKCYIFGTGDIDCTPDSELRLFGAGTGAVYYHSKPDKIANRSIGVKAHDRSQKNLATR